MIPLQAMMSKDPRWIVKTKISSIFSSSFQLWSLKIKHPIQIIKLFHNSQAKPFTNKFVHIVIQYQNYCLMVLFTFLNQNPYSIEKWKIMNCDELAAMITTKQDLICPGW